MVAMPAIDLTVAALWVGGLAAVLAVQAARSWARYGRAARAARGAARLAEATVASLREEAEAGRRAATATVIAFPRPAPPDGVARSRAAPAEEG